MGFDYVCSIKDHWARISYDNKLLRENVMSRRDFPVFGGQDAEVELGYENILGYGLMRVSTNEGVQFEGIVDISDFVNAPGLKDPKHPNYISGRKEIAERIISGFQRFAEGSSPSKEVMVRLK